MKAACRTLPVFLFIALAGNAAAEGKGAGRICGKITTQAGDGLLGAVITIFKQDNNGGTISFTRSDRKGLYSLSNLIPGAYYLQVSREGFQPLTTAQVKIDSGRTTTFNVILQEFINLISADPDPRNWDLKSVVRSTSDRRLIFRDLPGNPVPGEADVAFARGATINLTSSSGLSSDSYSVFPTSGQTGLVSNFAFTEPVSNNGRMIFAGQLNSGYDSYWQVRNTFQHRASPDRDIKMSVGYGRLTLNGPTLGSFSRPAQFFTQDPELRESGVQTVGFGFEARNRVLDTIALEYGFDLSRIYYGPTKSYFSPFFQVIITPADSWVLKTSIASRRLSENNSITLPDGEILNLLEPTYMAKIDGEIHLSQFKHSEVSIGRELDDETSIEVALYEDHMDGPGTPFLMSMKGRPGRHERVAQLTEEQAAQHGFRVAMNRRFLDFLNGSIAYVYGTGTSVSDIAEPVSSEVLARDLLSYMERTYYHSFTSRLNAIFPRTKTNITAVVRWYPGHPLTPMDLFADRFDMMSKGTNFLIRQPIPVPEFMGSTGRWEALVDVRNLFDQKLDGIRTTDGEVLLTRNPRSFRFGLNLNLY